MALRRGAYQKAIDTLNGTRGDSLAAGTGFQRAAFRGEFLIGVAGFEPAAPSSRTRCATRLRYTPTFGQDHPYTHATPRLQDHLVGSMN